MPFGHRIQSCLLSLLALSPLCAAYDTHVHDHDEGLHTFITRPEIKAPKFTVNITDPAHVTPGYWFVAPFEVIDQKFAGNGWIAPTIYDGNGELIWSGVEHSQNWDTLDFKMSNVRGEAMMTFMVQKMGEAFVLDNTYTVREKKKIGTLGKDFNSHELSFIANGTRALVLTEGRRAANELQTKTVGWHESCTVMFDGFRELDTETWNPVFSWNSYDHLSLNESSFLDGGVEKACKDSWAWDFLHANAVDKDQNGNYYLSARHTDTIYKISKDDGHVMWRLNGGRPSSSDFAMNDVSFSRQHNVRFRGFDGTYEFITILDNAKGQDEQKSTHENSRGMMIALNTKDMSAVMVSSIEHPGGHGSYAPRRGNYQQLPNGNIFMGWSEQAIHSEHLSTGEMVMEAALVPEWLGTYRAYKYDFEGRPVEKPRAHSAAYPSTSRNSTTTLVHVSWNGATEIAKWALYKTTDTGFPKIPIFQTNKTSFETAMAWDGYASYIIADALDKHGSVLGSTGVIKTVDPTASQLTGAVAEEVYWLQEVRQQNGDWKADVYEYAIARPGRYSVMIFFLGVVSSVVFFTLVRRLRHRSLFPLGKFGGGSPLLMSEGYTPVLREEMMEADEERLSARSSDRLL
ncbi:uncharacterized protein MYCGRDRAFT_102821 [Zymoseptoria tritici IPO323]|uniref:ASST-domain-containing protein n=1 Tax=Zymoseptoria tritici (strain CBS 115943 / IPO323) TaxID=336722 RepID=F9WWZ0_ZYMTI|nr:uncharacterized protein MYCGRDRAFT_102821 [Zymoseptoria tritici IPO323]EGP92037.1 hypothetical protein MYCGRDRAFT_102821 [Zymoseptoria tritici IPO323]